MCHVYGYGICVCVMCTTPVVVIIVIMGVTIVCTDNTTFVGLSTGRPKIIKKIIQYYKIQNIRVHVNIINDSDDVYTDVVSLNIRFRARRQAFYILPILLAVT